MATIRLLKFSEIFDIEVKDLFEFYHLQEKIELEKYLINEIKKLDEKQLKMVCKFIRSFVI